MQPRIHVSLTLTLDLAYWESPTSLIASWPGILQRRLSALIADVPDACQITTIDSQCHSEQSEVQDLAPSLCRAEADCHRLGHR